jgi:hypothetical protein
MPVAAAPQSEVRMGERRKTGYRRKVVFDDSGNPDRASVEMSRCVTEKRPPNGFLAGGMRLGDAGFKSIPNYETIGDLFGGGLFRPCGVGG